MPDEDSIPDQILEVPDQHSLANSGNAAVQFARAQGPSESRHRIVPFHRPSTTDNMASIGQSDISFFDTGISPPCLFTDIFVSMAF